MAIGYCEFCGSYGIITSTPQVKRYCSDCLEETIDECRFGLEKIKEEQRRKLGEKDNSN